MSHEKEYICDSIDRVTNLPSDSGVPKRLNLNPGRTGNIQHQLKLRIGAPIVVTSNHSKRKYREDGITNGSRGYVQAIQCSKDNPDKVDIVWVVFHDESVGRRYRFEHNHLRKHFDPGHKFATPILPSRKTFKTDFGNVEFQRQNFALSVAYAVTAHKSQGATIDEVIIDFTPEKNLKVKNYIIPGSFYVALTRVREGKSVYLRSFDLSYIQVNPAVQEKIDAMLKQRPYEYKKTYLDHNIFVNEGQEFKTGYLNINGLLDGNHIQYFNSDKNLQNLDLIVLAETKLDNSKQAGIEQALSNWEIVGRYDVSDSRKHMGLMLLKSKQSRFSGNVTLTYQTLKRNDDIQIQGLIVRLEAGLILGFIYCRSTPLGSEINLLKNYFEDCNAILGDLNLSHRIKSDQDKLNILCDCKRKSILGEITRSAMKILLKNFMQLHSTISSVIIRLLQ